MRNAITPPAGDAPRVRSAAYSRGGITIRSAALPSTLRATSACPPSLGYTSHGPVGESAVAWGVGVGGAVEGTGVRLASGTTAAAWVAAFAVAVCACASAVGVKIQVAGVGFDKSQARLASSRIKTMKCKR